MSTQDATSHDDKSFNILVNTRPKKVPGPSVAFELVLELAGFETTGQDLSLYDVEWRHGNDAGTLALGESVGVRNGMRFDAGKSNRS